MLIVHCAVHTNVYKWKKKRFLWWLNSSRLLVSSGVKQCSQIFAMTNLVQRSSHSRFSCNSQCSRGTSHTETRLGFIEHSWHSLSQWCHPGELASNMGISKFLKWEMVGTDIMCRSRLYSAKVNVLHFGVCAFSSPFSIEGTMVSFWVFVPTKVGLKLHVASLKILRHG